MPKPTTGELNALRQHRQQLLSKIAAIGDLRPGSIVERYRQCGKPNCHCAKEADGGHGPSWGVTRAVHGKTINRTVPKAALPAVREQIAEYRRFKDLSTELIEVSTRLCDAQLDLQGTASKGEAAQKGGSAVRSKRKSRSNSTR